MRKLTCKCLVRSHQQRPLYHCVCTMCMPGAASGTLRSSDPLFIWKVTVCMCEWVYIFSPLFACHFVYIRANMCSVCCVYNSGHSVLVCACVPSFGLGQLQLCQSEPLQMPELPEEEEKEEWGGRRGRGRTGKREGLPEEWMGEMVGVNCRSRWEERKQQLAGHRKELQDALSGPQVMFSQLSP